MTFTILNTVDLLTGRNLNEHNNYPFAGQWRFIPQAGQNSNRLLDQLKLLNNY